MIKLEAFLSGAFIGLCALTLAVSIYGVITLVYDEGFSEGFLAGQQDILRHYTCTRSGSTPPQVEVQP
jgi:hypothetical protein